MRMNKLTTKLQMALADAQSLALGKDHQFIEPLHILQALLTQSEGTIKPLLTQAGCQVNALLRDVALALSQRPQVSGTEGDVQLSNEAVKLLNVSDKLAQKRGDQFVSSELFLLAAAASKGQVASLLKQNGATESVIHRAIEQVFGG